MTRTLLLLALAVALAFAGCTRNGEPTPTTTTQATTTTTTAPVTTTPPVNDTNDTFGPNDFVLATSGLPASVEAGKSFTFRLYVNGTKNATSTHVGGLFGLNSTNGTTPTAAAYPNACQHAGGDFPGEFNVTCTAATPGLYYLRGHARLNSSGTTVDYWSNESSILVAGNYTVEVAFPQGTTARLNTPFNLTLYVNGTGNVTSSHLGAHYNTSSQASSPPSTTVYGSPCVHDDNGPLPGVYTVTCTFTDPTALQIYLRGHARLTDAVGKNYDYWGAEQTITVLPL